MRVLRCVLEVDHGGVGFGSSAGHRQWAMVDVHEQSRRRPQDGLPHGGQIRLLDECDKKPLQPNEAMMCASKWFDGSEGNERKRFFLLSLND